MKKSECNENLNKWFIMNHEKYYHNNKEFKNDFINFINTDDSDLKNLQFTDKKYINILANMFQTVESFYLKKYYNFDEFEKKFNLKNNSYQDTFVNLEVLSLSLKKKVLSYVNKLEYITNFIGWKNNYLFLYPIISLMCEGKIYKWNGSSTFEIVTTKITRQLYKDLDFEYDSNYKPNPEIKDNEKFKSLLFGNQIKKSVLKISPNSAFEPYNKFIDSKFLTVNQEIKTQDETIDISKLDIKEYVENPKKKIRF